MRWSPSLRVSSLTLSLFLFPFLLRSHFLGWTSSVHLIDEILVSSWPSSASCYQYRRSMRNSVRPLMTRRLPPPFRVGVTSNVWVTLTRSIRPPRSTRVFLGCWTRPSRPLATWPCLWMTLPNWRHVFAALLSPSPFLFGLSRPCSSF